MRLHNYWNKVCEDEKRSRLRNEQLLREFDDLETKARELEQRIAEVSAVKVCAVFYLFCAPVSYSYYHNYHNCIHLILYVCISLSYGKQRLLFSRIDLTLCIVCGMSNVSCGQV